MSLTSKLHFRKKRSKTLINSMLLAGIFPYDISPFDIRKYAWTIFSIVFLSYIVAFTSYNLTVLHGFMIKVSIVKTILSAAMCLTVLFITYLKRRDIMYLINATEKNFYTYTDEENFNFVSSTSNFSEKLTLYSAAGYFIGIYSSAILSHPIYLLFNRNLLKSGSKMLMFTWIPIKGNTVASFYAAHVVMFIITVPVVMTIVGNVWLTMNLQMEFKYQFERLTYALRSITERVHMQMHKKNSRFLLVVPKIVVRHYEHCENSDILPFTEEVNRIYEEKLVECVRHYQKIKKTYKRFHNWFGLTYSVILAHSVLTLAMMSYGALLNIKNFGVSVKYMSVLLLYTGQVYIHCNSGEKVFRMNEDLWNEIYNLEWYKQPASRRKLHYIFLCEAQKPLRLFGWLIYPASLTTFTSIMKLSYSYLNLLRTYGSSSRGR